MTKKKKEEGSKNTDQVANQLKNLTLMIKEVDLDGDGLISLAEFKKSMKEDLENGGFNFDGYQVGGTIREGQGI